MKTTKQFRNNRISILFSLTAIILFPFISNAQLKVHTNGKVRIGSSTSTPGTNLCFNDVNDATYGTGNDGITWYSPVPLDYGIYKTAGSWSSPNYQQLQINWKAGIILNPGTPHGKSYVDIQGNGLRVTSGNVGIGTPSPTKLFDIAAVNGRFTFDPTPSTSYYATAFSMDNTGLKIGHNSSFRDIEFQTGSTTTTKMTILAGGYVGIGTTNPNYALDVVATNTVTVGINTNGKVNATGGYTQVSDKMFKKDINSLPNALATISSLKPKSYYFDTAKFNGVGKFNFESIKQYGFIAQDVETILPELVSHYTKPAILDTLGNVVTPDYEYRALNYDAFIPILTKGIQELAQKNDSLKTKTNKQDSINVALQNQLNNLVSTINTCCNAMNTNGIKSLSDGVSQTNVELNNSQTIVLEQNIPNPYAERTTINYFLPDNVLKAQMLFYDAKGILIQSVDLSQTGKGALNVFAQDLTNGIYTYTLIVDGKIIETKKMVKQ